MKKCILIVGLLVVAGCASKVAKWENAGTLVSVRPADRVTTTQRSSEIPARETVEGPAFWIGHPNCIVMILGAGKGKDLG